ncbi:MULTISPECIES: class IV adenylate cyclase [Thermococcus]|uniref:Adenylate cyclase 2 n=2 Tax=Thermococcus sibiricus TaxID=172049 RepID=C6A4L2_THESM|nr:MULTISPECIES: class IV adenylate cyclase [Thermococcus]ACS90557.1 Adenylate cyclase 2 [Thermococcus sibiricus MM 739]KUK17648.1 MAG: Adenylate cyclase 2 [Thermococcus sibiricus]MBC7094522.1 class IV adenylate cyclase [Thermococcus sp.]
MIEIELKGYADDRVFRNIREAFEFMRKEIHEDMYFSHPCRDFSKTDEALRIRIKRFNGHFEALLTYKGPKIDNISKTRKEIEVTIDNVDAYIELLHALGFREVLTVKKSREKYYVEKGVTITLDEIEGLGKFVEIEKLETDERNIENEVKRLLKILESLGVKQFERKSYLELLMEKTNLSEKS